MLFYFVNNIFLVFFTNDSLIYSYDVLRKGKDLFHNHSRKFLLNDS
jgi:hypothetical protein